MRTTFILFFLLQTVLSFASTILKDSLPIEELNSIEDTLRPIEKLKKGAKEFFSKKDYKFNYENFSQLYPMRDNPTVGYLTKMNKNESIIFDVHPVISLEIFNNFRNNLKSGTFFSQAYSVIFRPQFRMYNDESKPVLMPSYRVFLGLKHLYLFRPNHLFSYSIESGHYSNGQSGSAIEGGGTDGSTESDSMWATITPNTKLSEVINRSNGDFSTNLTEFMFNYRYITHFDAYNKPSQIHSFSFGTQIYHNNLFGVADVGGYNIQAIKIYGKMRYLFAYTYSYNWGKGYRFNVAQTLEIIQGPHPSVNPIRSVTTATFYLRHSLGFYVSSIYGHDNYNLRFVDSGYQFGFGVTWDLFPPLVIGKGG